MNDKEFDLQAWLGEVKPVTKTVTVYGRPDLVEEINRIEKQAQAAAVRERSLGEKAPATLRRQADALRREYEESAIEVTVRARELGDLPAIEEAARKAPGDTEEWNIYASARWIVSPAMPDPDTVRLFVRKIGVVQFESVVVAAWTELATKVPTPTPPLSLRP